MLNPIYFLPLKSPLLPPITTPPSSYNNTVSTSLLPYSKALVHYYISQYLKQPTNLYPDLFPEAHRTHFFTDSHNIYSTCTTSTSTLNIKHFQHPTHSCIPVFNMPVKWNDTEAFTRLLAAMVAAQDMKVCPQICFLPCHATLQNSLRKHCFLYLWSEHLRFLRSLTLFPVNLYSIQRYSHIETSTPTK